MHPNDQRYSGKVGVCSYCGQWQRKGQPTDPCRECQTLARLLFKHGYQLQRDGTITERPDWQPGFPAPQEALPL